MQARATKLPLERRFGLPDGVKLPLERRFGVSDGVKFALLAHVNATVAVAHLGATLGSSTSDSSK